MSRLIKYEGNQQVDSSTKLIELKQLNIHSVEDATELPNIPEIDIEEERRVQLFHAQAEADALITDAKLQVSAMKQQIEAEQSNWANEKKQLMDTASQTGYDDGLEAGKSAGYAEYLEIINEAKQIVKRSKTVFAEHITEAEKVILDLAIKTAERIINERLSEQPEMFISLVKRALREAREYKEVQIHVHPAKYELLIAEKLELDAIFPNDVQCYIYPNPDLTETACFIESENGRIDASIDSQLKEVKSKLLGLLEGVSE